MQVAVEPGLEAERWWSCRAAAAVAGGLAMGVRVRMGERELGRHRCVLLLRNEAW